MPAASSAASPSTRPDNPTAVGNPSRPGPAGRVGLARPQRFAVPSMVRTHQRFGSSAMGSLREVATLRMRGRHDRDERLAQCVHRLAAQAQRAQKDGGRNRQRVDEAGSVLGGAVKLAEAQEVMRSAKAEVASTAMIVPHPGINHLLSAIDRSIAHFGSLCANSRRPGVSLLCYNPLSRVRQAPSFVLRGIWVLSRPVRERAENTMATAESEATTEPTRSAKAARARRDADAGAAAYAIIETGGKQYRVVVGDTLAIEKLPVETGSEVTFDRVLMVGGDGPARVGTPLIDGASVQAQVQDQYRAPKIIVFKYKPKKRYRRRLGHRQSLTRVAITAINA
jgi:large subunit ribosomal protein L21